MIRNYVHTFVALAVIAIGIVMLPAIFMPGSKGTVISVLGMGALGFWFGSSNEKTRSSALLAGLDCAVLAAIFTAVAIFVVRMVARAF